LGHPSAQERLARRDDGRALYRLRRPGHDPQGVPPPLPPVRSGPGLSVGHP
jgi:hypothetical protein